MTYRPLSVYQARSVCGRRCDTPPNADYAGDKITESLLPATSPKQPRACIFCGATKNITEEHVFSVWMHKYLPTRNRRSRYALMSRERINDFKTKEGGVNSLRQRVVCRNCNNTWMSATETKVKASLIPLMAAEKFGLTAERQRDLARWAVLKSIVLEYDDAAFSQQECREFMRNSNLSDKCFVWIARCGSERWRTRALREQTSVAVMTGYWHRVVTGVLQSTAIGLNELFIYVVLNNHEAIRIAVPTGLFQVWPMGDELSWPPSRILNTTEAEEIATGILRFTRQWPPAAYGLAPSTISPPLSGRRDRV